MNGTAVWMYFVHLLNRTPCSSFTSGFFFFFFFFFCFSIPPPPVFRHATAGKCFFSGVQYMINPSVSSVSKWEIVTTCICTCTTYPDYVPLRFSTFPTAVSNISCSIFIWLFPDSSEPMSTKVYKKLLQGVFNVDLSYIADLGCFFLPTSFTWFMW